MHGAFAGAPRGNTNRLVHGRYTAAAIAERREAQDAMQQLRALAAELKKIDGEDAQEKLKEIDEAVLARCSK